MTGRMMSERLGKLHFWGSFLGAYATFLPMHITGLAGEPRHYAQLTGIPNAAGHLLAGAMSMQLPITYGAFFLAAAQLPFLYNLARSIHHGLPALANPWQATTLEWHPDLAPFAGPPASNDSITVHRAPCEYSEVQGKGSFLTQWSTGQNPE